MEIYSGANPSLQARTEQASAVVDVKDPEEQEDEENIQISMNPEWVQWYTEYKKQQYGRSQVGQGSVPLKTSKTKSVKQNKTGS